MRRVACGRTALVPVPADLAIPSPLDACQVGHNALGAGQVIDQGASLVDKALASGSIYEGALLHWIFMTWPCVPVCVC